MGYRYDNQGIDMKKKKITLIGWVIIVLIAIAGLAGSYAIRMHHDKLVIESVAKALYRINKLLIKKIEKQSKPFEHELKRL